MTTEVQTKIGRPLAEIDWNLFEQFLKLGSTEKEICSFFNIAITTLLRHIKKRYGDDANFDNVYDRFTGERNISLRRMRHNHAKKNWNACQELCARYLNEYPLLNKDPEQKANDLASLLKMVLEGKITQPSDVNNM